MSLEKKQYKIKFYYFRNQNIIIKLENLMKEIEKFNINDLPNRNYKADKLIDKFSFNVKLIHRLKKEYKRNEKIWKNLNKKIPKEFQIS